MYYNLVHEQAFNTGFQYLCPSSDGTYAFGNILGQLLFLKEDKAKQYADLTKPKLNDIYLTVIDNKNMISDNIADVVTYYLTHFDKDAKVSSCQHDMVLKSLDNNFQINMQVNFVIRQQIAQLLVEHVCPDMTPELKANCTNIIASAGNTAALTGALANAEEEYEDIDNSEDEYADYDEIDDTYEEDEEVYEDEEEFDEFEETYEEDDEDFFEQTEIDKLYGLLAPEQIQLLQEFSLWNSQRLFNKATDQTKLNVTRQISMRKAKELDQIRGDDSWVYAGWYKVHRGFQTCSLGHHLTNVHLAWRLDEDADISESFWGQSYNNHIEDLIKSGRCIRFGSTCVGDFFDIDKSIMAQILKAQRDTERDLKMMYEIYSAGTQDEAMKSYSILDSILPNLKMNDAKALILKRPYSVPYMEPGVIAFYEKFKTANMLMPKMLVQLIRDNIMRWTSHCFTHQYSEKDVNTILHMNGPKEVAKMLTDIWGTKYADIAARVSKTQYFASVSRSTRDYSNALPYMLNHMFMYETCGIYKFDADKQKDEGGTSRATKEALEKLKYVMTKFNQGRTTIETLDLIEAYLKVYLQICNTLIEKEKIFFEKLKYNYILEVKRSYKSDYPETAIIPVYINTANVLSVNSDGTVPYEHSLTVSDGTTEVEMYVKSEELTNRLPKVPYSSNALNIDNTRIYTSYFDYDSFSMKFITTDDKKKYYNDRCYLYVPFLNYLHYKHIVNPMELDKELVCDMNRLSLLVDLENIGKDELIELSELAYVGVDTEKLDKMLSLIQQIDPEALAEKYNKLCDEHLSKLFKPKTAAILKTQEKQDLSEVPVNTIEDLIEFLSNNVDKLQDDKYELHRGVLNTANSYEDKSSISIKMLFRLQEAYEAITGKEAPDYQIKMATVQDNYTKLDDVPDIKKKLEYMVHQMPNKLQQRDLNICQTVLKYQRYSKNQSYAVMRAVNIYNGINP